ncbi:DUF4304 domain-containing protein [Halovulum dunhuangense]|uniref:DUF4304 domain-containing protein n=1 Tax=Halovulum dunhuangense TaxID=1505036 RepID=A0A849L1P3_9RHOB|nr:DUF4304 domain-containing protein [Halovulum dunhuangense]NNU80174.1 DUF4304 domain-containing protein [Halovulum dunhuangense]
MAPTGPFQRLDEGALDLAARAHGFTRRAGRNWVRQTADFIQLLNLQHSQWAPEDRYLNFALWPLALGMPPSLSERRFLFRTRADVPGASDLDEFFAVIDGLRSLAQLRDALGMRRISGLVSKDLRPLL